MSEQWTVVDAHKHFVPGAGAGGRVSIPLSEYADLLRDETGGRWLQAMDVAGTVRGMDEAGIEMAVMHQAAWSLLGLDACRAMNNAYATIAAEYPDKFILCAQVPPEGRQEVLGELDRAIDVLGLNGVAMLSSAPDLTIDSEELFPLFGKISQLGIPIVVHPRSRAAVWGGTKYGLSSHVSKEYDVAKAT